MTLKERFLFRNVDSFSLGLFRFFFGAFMLIEMFYYLTSGFYKGSMVLPQFNFSYDFLEFIKPMGETGMGIVHFLMAAAAVCIMIGFRTRIAAGVFFVLFTYFILCCRGVWNNHFYLFSLISFLLMFIDSDRSFSMEKRNKEKEKIVPIWQLNIFRLQIFVVYFFGGIAKLNPDWLIRHEPMKKTLEVFSPGGFLSSEGVVALFAYGGLLFDLSIGFLLMFKKTRLLAVAGVIFFNFTNSIIYNDIGIFPFLMLAVTLIFFDPEGAVVNKIKGFFTNNRIRKPQITSGEFSPSSQKVVIGLALFFAFQFLFPLRHFVITDNLIWTGTTRNFSWHMKVQQRGGEEIAFYIVDKAGGEETIFNYEAINNRINNQQIKYMNETPVMAWQFANWLEKRLNAELYNSKKKRFEDLEIYSRIKTSFNGREPQYIIDPNVDLTKADYSPFGPNEWMLPVQE